MSSDFVTDTHSSIVDSTAGLSLTPKFHKLVSWYGAHPAQQAPRACWYVLLKVMLGSCCVASFCFGGLNILLL